MAARNMAARGDVPSDALKRVFRSLIGAYAEKITPEHGFKIKSDTLWGRMRGLKKIIYSNGTSSKNGGKTISKSVNEEDRHVWQWMRHNELSDVVSEIERPIWNSKLKYLLESERRPTQPDINALQSWIKSVAGHAEANTVWVEWLEKNPEMNQIIKDANEVADKMQEEWEKYRRALEREDKRRGEMTEMRTAVQREIEAREEEAPGSAAATAALLTLPPATAEQRAKDKEMPPRAYVYQGQAWAAEEGARLRARGAFGDGKEEKRPYEYKGAAGPPSAGPSSAAFAPNTEHNMYQSDYGGGSRRKSQRRKRGRKARRTRRH